MPTVVSRAVRLRRLAALAERGQCAELSSRGVRCQRHKGHKGGCRTDLSFSEAEAIGLRPSSRGLSGFPLMASAARKRAGLARVRA